MKKKKIIVGLLLITFAVACGQADKEFNAVVTFNKGFRFTPTGTIYTSMPSGSGVADWNTMINKPSVFPPATHDHNLLYKPIGYVPTWAEITGKPTFFDGTWASLSGKPTTFPSTWATVTGKPTVFNPDVAVTNPLYKPIGYTPTWDDVSDKPESIELADAILTMSGIRLPVLTTAQINALTNVTVGTLVYDSTANVLKIYTGSWKVIITNL